MRTQKTYLARNQRRSEKFARMRKRGEEIRMAQPPPDYPPIRIPGTLLKSGTLRDHLTGETTIIELRVPERGRRDQFAVTVNGKSWPKHQRPVGISAVREKII